MVGLVGTRKSFLADAIGCRMQGAVVSSDAISLAAPAVDDSCSAKERAHIYDEVRRSGAGLTPRMGNAKSNSTD